MKLSQKEAVYTTTMNVLNDMGIEFAGNTDVCTDEARNAVLDILCEGFQDGKFELEDTESNREKLANQPKLRAYVSGLVSNWFRKDTRLNGGVAYVAKNPGSRAGSTDPEIKALRILAKNYDEGSTEHATIQSAIAEKLAEIKASKAPQVDVSMISPEIRAKLGL